MNDIWVSPVCVSVSTVGLHCTGMYRDSVVLFGDLVVDDQLNIENIVAYRHRRRMGELYPDEAPDCSSCCFLKRNLNSLLS